ncbi:LOW QUALITY PROTEIN: zinc finger SWIM domain-containing protein 1 [Phaethornis superciliosus]
MVESAAARRSDPAPCSPPAAPRLPAVLQPDTPQAPLLQSRPKCPQSLLDPSTPAAKLQTTEIPESNKGQTSFEQPVIDLCRESAARLSEFAVLQQWVQVISRGGDALGMQVLEDAHGVDLKGLNSCTCCFSQALHLPGQHILVLNSEKTLQPEMLSRQWQKEHSHHAEDNSADGLVEVLMSSWNESSNKSLVVSFLMVEISQLLTHSSEEFGCRYRTLQVLADSWIGPYVEPVPPLGLGMDRAV